MVALVEDKGESTISSIPAEKVKEYEEIALSICEEYEKKRKWIGFVKLEKKMAKKGVPIEIAKEVIRKLIKEEIVGSGKNFVEAKDGHMVKPVIFKKEICDKSAVGNIESSILALMLLI